MSRKSWHLDRRSFLRGAGVACSLPFLESMAWARTQDSAAPRRLCVVYFPNGCSLPDEGDSENAQWRWFPSGAGRDFRFTKVLASLEPYRDQLSVFGGLSHPKSRELLGHLAGDTFLTAGDVRGDAYLNSVSVDQVAARQLQRHTRYPSLVLSTDGGVGYKSRVSTLSFNHHGKPIPSEHRQRQIFERYFAPHQAQAASRSTSTSEPTSGPTSGSTSERRPEPAPEPTAERRRSLAQGKKIVDLVLEDSRRLRGKLGELDRAKLDEYLESLNSVEEQIRRNEAWLDIPMKPFDAAHIDLDPDPRVDPTAYLRATFDLLVLAFQTDLTRVATYMLGREDGMGFGDNFPKLALGIERTHHTISHDVHEGHWEQWGPFDAWYAQQFTYFVERMSTTQDEHGPLLDSSLLLYGSSCSTTHNARNCPLLVAGGRAMGATHGQYSVHDASVPLSNLYVSLLNGVGVETERFGDSTGALPGLFA